MVGEAVCVAAFAVYSTVSFLLNHIFGQQPNADFSLPDEVVLSGLVIPLVIFPSGSPFLAYRQDVKASRPWSINYFPAPGIIFMVKPLWHSRQ
jgi:hypothetical protein